MVIRKEYITCPECITVQLAEVTLEDGHPWPSFVHFCEKCGYTITESEWEEAPAPWDEAKSPAVQAVTANELDFRHGRLARVLRTDGSVQGYYKVAADWFGD